MSISHLGKAAQLARATILAAKASYALAKAEGRNGRDVSPQEKDSLKRAVEYLREAIEAKKQLTSGPVGAHFLLAIGEMEIVQKAIARQESRQTVELAKYLEPMIGVCDQLVKGGNPPAKDVDIAKRFFEALEQYATQEGQFVLQDAPVMPEFTQRV